MANVARSLRHAARRLRRAPVFTITSVLTLAIGIGACALMMSVVSTILLKRLPYGQPDRLEMIWGYYPDANLGFREQPTHGIVFSIIRDNTQAFESIAAFRGASYNLGDATNPERLDGVQATGEFFQTLGVAPEIGRFFERANETLGSDHVAILSDAAWRRRFGGDPNVIGRALILNAEPYASDSQKGRRSRSAERLQPMFASAAALCCGQSRLRMRPDWWMCSSETLTAEPQGRRCPTGTLAAQIVAPVAGTTEADRLAERIYTTAMLLASTLGGA
jgi:hypothetical protein